MPGTNHFQQPPNIQAKTTPLNIGSLSYNKQRQNNNIQPNRQQQYYRNFQTSVIKPIRSNQSLILPGMGVIGRSIKFEVSYGKIYRLKC